MTVQDLINSLSEMNPNSQVRLAVQPSYPFAHRIDRAVEVLETIDGLTWGVFYNNIEDADEEFNESETNTEDAAFDDLYRFREELHDELDQLKVGAIYKGKEVSLQEAREISRNAPTVVYIGEGGQIEYLDSNAKNELGW